MPTKKRSSLKVLSIDDFSGGLNTFVSASKIEDNELSVANNVEYLENGLPGKRRGVTAVGNEPNNRILGLGTLYTAAGVRKLLHVSGTALYELSSNTWNSISGKTFLSNTMVNMVQAKDALYMHNGSDKMRKYDGSTLSEPAYSCTAKYGIYYSSRHVAAGSDTYPSRLFFSSSKSADNFEGLTGTATAGATATITDSGASWTTNEFQNLKITITAGTGTGQVRTISSNTGTVITVSESWTTNPDTTSQYSIEGGDTIDIAKDDGQKVIGIAKFEDKLIIFKEFSIYQLTFDSNGFPIVDLVSASNGCVSHRSIENVENDVLYMSHDGIRSLGYVVNIPGVIRTNIVSAKIKPDITNVNSELYDRIACIYTDNKFLTSIPSGSSANNNIIFCLDMIFGAYSRWTGLSAACFTEYVDSDNMMTVYFGSDDSGQVYEMFSTARSDDGVAIDYEVRTKQFDLGSFDLRKRLFFTDQQFRSLTGTVDIAVIVDGSSTAKAASLSSTFSAQDGWRSGSTWRGIQMWRESTGSTADIVASEDVRRIRINKNCRNAQLKVSNSTVNENVVLMALSLAYKEYSPYAFPSTKIIQ